MKEFENVYFIDSPRFNVYWGSIIQSFTEIVMNQAALKFFPNSLYISFHSESDYPIVPPDLIVSYFKKNYPKNYMQTIPPNKEGWKAERKNDFRFFFNNEVNSKINRMAKILFPNKTIPDAKWRSGWNWFTITLKDSYLMIQMMSKRFDLIDTLDYVLYSDEIIFDTLAAEANISSTSRYLRYIDWRTRNSHPLVFNENHINDILRRRCEFWARKFNVHVSDKVLNMVDEHIKNFSQEDKKNILMNC